MQSLQADQSLYNHKGVCYISFNTWSFPGWQEYIFLTMTAKINKFRQRRRLPPDFFARLLLIA